MSNRILGVVMGAFICDNCIRLNIASVDIGTVSVDDLASFIERRNDRIQWLPRRGVAQSYQDVPDHISAAASEAHQCHSISAYRAAVQLARSVIEATAKEQGFTTGSLVAKIDALFDAQRLRPHIREAAHEIRHLGNEMAHGDFVQPVSEEESSEILGLMAEVLHEIYQSPARVERLRQARLTRATGQEPQT